MLDAGSDAAAGSSEPLSRITEVCSSSDQASLHTHTRAVNQNPTMQPTAVPAFRGGPVFYSLLQGGVQTIKALRSIDMIF